MKAQLVLLAALMMLGSSFAHADAVDSSDPAMNDSARKADQAANRGSTCPLLNAASPEINANTTVADQSPSTNTTGAIIH